jgi:hypothetical protein
MTHLSLDTIITAIIITGFILYLIIASKNKSKFGINLKRVHCPVCNTKQPIIRKPGNVEQALYGGTTCPKCQTNLDKYGNVINATNKRQLLLNKIIKQGFPKNEVFVSVKDFFDGNEDPASIGIGIFPDPPPLKEFYKVLTEVKNAPDTKEVLIRIADIEGVDWFYSDVVYVFGEYDIDEVRRLFKPLKPDEIYEGLMHGMPPNVSGLNDNKAYSVWWD